MKFGQSNTIERSITEQSTILLNQMFDYRTVDNQTLDYWIVDSRTHLNVRLPNSYLDVFLLILLILIKVDYDYSCMFDLLWGVKRWIPNKIESDWVQFCSIEHAILDIVNAIQSNMDKGAFSCGVFIDLKKAFDTVDHRILLHKLEFYGFHGFINAWFASYLNERSQVTVVGCHSSDKSQITCGVPQDLC